LAHYALGDDKPLYPYWRVPLVIEDYELTWGIEMPVLKREGAHSYNYFVAPPLKEEKDLRHLRIPDIASHIASQRRQCEAKAAQYQDLLGDIIPVRVVADYWTCLGHLACRLMGMQELMINMHLKPDLVHQLMKFLSDGCLSILDTLEELHVFTPESHCHDWYLIPQNEPTDTQLSRFYSKTRDLWGRAESQNYDLVGPDMTYEFLIQYQIPILNRFNLVSYGCCENLSDKWDQVSSIPNLRIVVNSPWANIHKTVEKCKDRYCILYRPHWDPIIRAQDDTELQQTLNAKMSIMQGCHRVIVFEDHSAYLAATDRPLAWKQKTVRQCIAMTQEAVSRYQ